MKNTEKGIHEGKAFRKLIANEAKEWTFYFQHGLHGSVVKSFPQITTFKMTTFLTKITSIKNLHLI